MTLSQESSLDWKYILDWRACDVLKALNAESALASINRSISAASL